MDHPIRRPTASDTEEDLIRMQEHFIASGNLNCSPAARCHRLNNPSQTSSSPCGPSPTQSTSSPSPCSESQSQSRGETRKTRPSSSREARNPRECGRFTISLDSINEQLSQVVGPVQEKNIEYLKASETNCRFVFERNADSSLNDGFPAPLNLSGYFAPGNGHSTATADAGKSFFAREFDRLQRGEDCRPSLGVQQPAAAIASSTFATGEGNLDAQLDEENSRRLRAMSTEEVTRAREEILQRFDPSLVEFLRKRGQKRVKDGVKSVDDKCSTTEESSSSERLLPSLTTSLDDAAGDCADQSMTAAHSRVDDAIRNLEVIETNDLDAYSRLAADAVQFDFAVKCLRTVLPRQEQALLRLFESLRVEGGDPLIHLAASQIDDIKRTFLQTTFDESSQREVTRFVAGVNPLVDGCWMLQPIRAALDRVHQRAREGIDDRVKASEDLLAVQSALLWSVFLLLQRTSLFFTFATPVEVYCRIAEIFLFEKSACSVEWGYRCRVPDSALGIVSDHCVRLCIDRLLLGYIVPQAQKHRLALSLEKPCAGLDAFLPFYADLLRRFEEDSCGDLLWSQLILIAGYMNTNREAAGRIRLEIWANERRIARQITIAAGQATYLIEYLDAEADFDSRFHEEGKLEQYKQLLLLQAAALRREEVTRERNGLMFEIASRQLTHFLRKHTKGKGIREHRNYGVVSSDGAEEAGARLQDEFDVMVAMVRAAVGDIIPTVASIIGVDSTCERETGENK